MVIEKKTQLQLPIVICAEGRIGKRICEKFIDDDRECWFYETVVGGRDGVNPLFDVKYDHEDKMFKYKLMDD